MLSCLAIYHKDECRFQEGLCFWMKGETHNPTGTSGFFSLSKNICALNDCGPVNPTPEEMFKGVKLVGEAPQLH